MLGVGRAPRATFRPKHPKLGLDARAGAGPCGLAGRGAALAVARVATAPPPLAGGDGYSYAARASASRSACFARAFASRSRSSRRTTGCGCLHLVITPPRLQKSSSSHHQRHFEDYLAWCRGPGCVPLPDSRLYQWGMQALSSRRWVDRLIAPSMAAVSGASDGGSTSGGPSTSGSSTVLGTSRGGGLEGAARPLGSLSPV